MPGSRSSSVSSLSVADKDPSTPDKAVKEVDPKKLGRYAPVARRASAPAALNVAEPHRYAPRARANAVAKPDAAALDQLEWQAGAEKHYGAWESFADKTPEGAGGATGSGRVKVGDQAYQVKGSIEHAPLMRRFKAGDLNHENYGEVISSNVARAMVGSANRALIPEVSLRQNADRHEAMVTSRYLANGGGDLDKLYRDRAGDLPKGQKHAYIQLDSTAPSGEGVLRLAGSAAQDLKRNIALSALLGDHDVNPGNMIAVQGGNRVGRIDFGHAFNELISAPVGAISGGGGVRFKDNRILDFFNRDTVSGMSKAQQQSKLWRDYSGVGPSEGMTQALREMASSQESLDGLAQAKTQFLDLIVDLENENTPEARKQLQDLTQSLAKISANVEKPVTRTDPGGVVQEVFQNLDTFVREGQAQMKDVANLSSLQTQIDDFVKNPANRGKGMPSEIFNLYSQLARRPESTLKMPNGAGLHWMKTDKEMPAFQGNLEAYVAARRTALGFPDSLPKLSEGLLARLPGRETAAARVNQKVEALNQQLRLSGNGENLRAAYLEITDAILRETKADKAFGARPEVMKLNALARVVSDPGRIDFSKITDPQVRDVATQLTARLEKFQKGIDLAGRAGLKGVAGVKVEAQLQNLFEMANAHGDAAMLSKLLDATSFEGKLSMSDTTSSDGRAATRAAQLLRALEGDGNYETIKENINKLSTDGPSLRAMARDPKLLSGLDKNVYVDANKLLRTTDGPTHTISDIHREWYLEQATLMKAFRELDGRDLATQKQLALAMLQSFAKAAPMGQDKAEEIGAQVSPLYNQSGVYHRSAVANKLLNDVLNDFCKDMGVTMGSAHLVDNSTFGDVVAREYTMPGVQTKAATEREFESSIQQLFDLAKQGKFPDGPVALDVTGMYKNSGLEPKDQALRMTADLEKQFLRLAETFLNDNPGVDKNEFAGMMSKLQVVAFAQHKGVDVMLTPKFLYRGAGANVDNETDKTDLQKKLLTGASQGGRNSSHTDFFDAVEHSMISGGYRLDPIQARKAWLEVTPAKDILLKSGIQITELATSDRPTPTLFNSFKDFTEHRTFQQFEALAQMPNPSPYVKVLVGATSAMLKGLNTANVDQTMNGKGLNEVLQTSYFRMLNGMAEAVHNSGDMVKFNNAIELLQQEVATVLSLVEPHTNNTFGDGIRATLTSNDGPNSKPVIPSGLDPAKVHLKPSAMHCLSSILSSVEAQKGGNQLNVAVVKDHYYESSGAIETSKTYSVSSIDGDSLSGSKPLDPNSLAGQKPLDVYVCDFHHNISLGRDHYQVENLQHHVDQLFDKDLVSEKFTVAIDCTIDHVKSPDIQAFLEHNKDRIAEGKLNVVFFRSAQKFDMLGMDNYYGGFSVSVNRHDAFTGFNTRMDAPEDQLKGISQQGLSHVSANAAAHMDEYRDALMQNTKRFYEKLPPDMIWSEGNASAMQIAKTDDPNAVFLDIRFPGNTDASNAFVDRIKAFATAQGLPLTGRASFGFATTNLNLIHGEKTRLTPGLEGSDVQDRYIAFFAAAHACANKAKSEGIEQELHGDELNKYVAKQIEQMDITSI